MGIGVGRRSSLDRTKTDPEAGWGHSMTDDCCWMAGGDKHEKSMGNYGDRVNCWESRVAGLTGKGTGLESSRVVDSSGELKGQRNDGRHRDDQRWIRMQLFSCPVGVDRVVCPSFREEGGEQAGEPQQRRLSVLHQTCLFYSLPSLPLPSLTLPIMSYFFSPHRAVQRRQVAHPS